jgi:7-carboxy-7-deazaguanine synthase
MRALISLSLAALLLAACGSQPPAPEQDPAGVESRKPGAVKVDTPPVTQVKPVTRTVRPEQHRRAEGSAQPAVQAQRLLRLRQLRGQGRVPVAADAHGKFLAANPKMKMLIQGNADERGSREYNLALGQKRAEAVRKALALLGAREEQLEAVSLGEEKPACSEGTRRLLGQEPPRRHALLGRVLKMRMSCALLPLLLPSAVLPARPALFDDEEARKRIEALRTEVTPGLDKREDAINATRSTSPTRSRRSRPRSPNCAARSRCWPTRSNRRRSGRRTSTSTSTTACASWRRRPAETRPEPAEAKPAAKSTPRRKRATTKRRWPGSRPQAQGRAARLPRLHQGLSEQQPDPALGPLLGRQRPLPARRVQEGHRNSSASWPPPGPTTSRRPTRCSARPTACRSPATPRARARPWKPWSQNIPPAAPRPSPSSAWPPAVRRARSSRGAAAPAGRRSMTDLTATLRITEIFHSLQGESTRAGLPTVFVRLTGCPLRCAWCDTDYAFSGRRDTDAGRGAAGGGKARRAPRLRHRRRAAGAEGLPAAARRAVRCRLRGLAGNQRRAGHFAVSTRASRASWTSRRPASGEADRNHWENLGRLNARDELKIVLADEADYEWARKSVCAARRLDAICPVLLSPAQGQLDPAQLAQWILDDRLPLRFQLQLHKVLWGSAQGR